MIVIFDNFNSLERHICKQNFSRNLHFTALKTINLFTTSRHCHSDDLSFIVAHYNCTFLCSPAALKAFLS